MKYFKEWQMSAVDSSHSGLSSIVTYVEITDLINQRIWGNERISTDDTLDGMSITHVRKHSNIARPTKNIMYWKQ
jgi:hypothetical protein